MKYLLIFHLSFHSVYLFNNIYLEISVNIRQQFSSSTMVCTTLQVNVVINVLYE